MRDGAPAVHLGSIATCPYGPQTASQKLVRGGTSEAPWTESACAQAVGSVEGHYPWCTCRASGLAPGQPEPYAALRDPSAKVFGASLSSLSSSAPRGARCPSSANHRTSCHRPTVPPSKTAKLQKGHIIAASRAKQTLNQNTKKTPRAHRVDFAGGHACVAQSQSADWSTPVYVEFVGVGSSVQRLLPRRTDC